MKKNSQTKKNQSKSQIEIDQTILKFLGDTTIATTDDLVVIKNRILNFFEFRLYNDKTKKHADSIQWKRTASEILQDKYVYVGKACSDLAVVLLSLCKAAGIDGRLVKLKSINDKEGHSIAEVSLNNKWYRIDPSSRDSVPFEGELTDKFIWNKKFKVWKKGRDVWDLGLKSIEDEYKLSRFSGIKKM